MKKILNILFMALFIVLSIILGVLSIRLLEENRSLKKENQKLVEQSTDTEETISGLQEKLAKLERNVTDTDEKENDSQLKQEAQITKSAVADAVDVKALAAGTIVSGDEVDESNFSKYFVAETISDEVLGRINGKSYYENPDIGLDELRYLKVLHYNFEHEIQVGEVIVNAELSEDFRNIFMELFREEYEIQSMYLVDNYWTGNADESDSASIDQNNTSAFCYRYATGSSKLSNHAFGRAIDINPQQNPYVSYSSGEPYWSHSNADPYIDRESGLAHVITHDDICYEIFADHGFTWGGDWENGVKDYQHFDKAAQ